MYVIAALYMLDLPVAGMLALTLVLTFYIALEDILELRRLHSFDGFRDRVRFFVDDVISLLLAGLIFFHWPSSSLAESQG